MGVIPPKIGGYDILQKIGEGSFGVVYEARHAMLGREVLLKVLKPSVVQDQSTMERFRREVRSLASLHHPNVIRILDAGMFDEAPFLVTERIKGETLANRLDKKTPMTLVEAANLMRSIATGVSALHRNQIVHGDLNASNILLKSEGQPIIGDLGLASCIMPERSSGGTMEYAAPETLALGRRTPPSDVYSLGVMFHQLVTGSVPSSSKLGTEYSSVQPGIPNALKSICRNSVAQNPSERPTASEFAAELDHWLRHHEELSEAVETAVSVSTSGKRDRESKTMLRSSPDRDEGWSDEKNARRCTLIDKDIQQTISEREKEELFKLTEKLRAYRKKVSPRPLDELVKLHRELLQKPRK